jgi:hypothetical protein
VTDRDAVDDWPQEGRSRVAAGLRLLLVFVVALVLPMILIAAMIPAHGACGEAEPAAQS